jgi:hypothetical protein
VAEDVKPHGAEASPAAGASSYRRHFGFVYFALAVVLGAAGATVVYALVRPGYEPPPAWSDWKPTGDLATRVSSIQTYVSQHYRFTDGRPLVNIRGAPLQTSDGQPVAAYLVRTSTPVGEQDVVINAGDGLSFSLFGNGKNGAITFGKPSEERGRIVRREALELALYTLKYAHEVGSVVVFLPPLPTKPDRQEALLFRRASLRDQLEAPLAETLSQGSFNTVTGSANGGERQLLDSLTLPRLYSFTFRQDPSGAQLLVLTPLAA